MEKAKKVKLDCGDWHERREIHTVLVPISVGADMRPKSFGLSNNFFGPNKLKFCFVS
jgi:hypothetical protein